MGGGADHAPPAASSEARHRRGAHRREDAGGGGGVGGSRGVDARLFFVDVDRERESVLIHIIDASDPAAFRRQQEDFYNRYQRKVFP